MYAEIRKYNSSSVDEVIRRANEGFVPLISTHAGFKAYYILKEEPHTFASISIFETQAEARESNKLAADWVHQNLASLLPQPPEITEGEVRVAKEK
ncbi:MAG: hypothetical protein WCF84_11485 [Anaerolineae bacterium]